MPTTMQNNNVTQDYTQMIYKPFDRKYKTFIDMNDLLDMDEKKLSVDEIVNKVREKIVTQHTITSASDIMNHCVVYIIVHPSKRCQWALDDVLKSIYTNVTDALYITMSYKDVV